MSLIRVAQEGLETLLELLPVVVVVVVWPGRMARRAATGAAISAHTNKKGDFFERVCLDPSRALPEGRRGHNGRQAMIVRKPDNIEGGLVRK